MRKAFALFLIMAITPFARADGPFGIEIGAPITDYPSCQQSEDEPSWYTCVSVPKPHPDFAFYLVQATDATGVCTVRAAGKDIDDNAFGLGTISAVDELSGQIAQTYGSQHRLLDFIAPGALWDGPDEWLSAIDQKERTYMITWDEESNYQPVNHVALIFIKASASNRNTGYASVAFDGDNKKRCEEIVAADEASAF